MNRLVAILLPAILCSACLKEGDFKSHYTGFEPTSIQDDWTISTPEQENIDVSHLDQAFQLLYDRNRFLMAKSLLVVRNGKLVAEAYPHQLTDRDTYANIQSCTKSITSMIMGAAIQDGIPISLDDKLHDLYPELFDEDLRKREMTIHDALTMQAGLAFSNKKNTLQLYQTKSNSAKFVLSFPYRNMPGTIMNYNDGAPHLISKAIEVSTGKTMHDYAKEKLFDPLNIRDWKWESAHDGTTFGAFSLFLKPRDLAKLGQLLLQHGRWNNQQLLDPDYLSVATSHLATSENGRPYGYYFWLSEQHQGYYAHGHGGQVLLVVPSLELVLLYTAWPYTSGRHFDNAFDLFDRIIAGCS